MAILVAALVIGAGVPGYLYIVENARRDRAIEQITDMQRDITRFKRKNNRFPDTLAEIFPRTQQDPWGNAYFYLNIANSPNPASINSRKDNNLKPLNVDFDLYSAGGDGLSLSPIGASESRDDIVRADNGDYVGIAADL